MDAQRETDGVAHAVRATLVDSVVEVVTDAAAKRVGERDGELDVVDDAATLVREGVAELHIERDGSSVSSAD